MGYVVERQGRGYTVGYEGLRPTTGADRRVGTERRTSWRRACFAAGLPNLPRLERSNGLTLARFVRTQWLPARRQGPVRDLGFCAAVGGGGGI